MSNQENHQRLASEFNRDEARVNWHDQSLWFIRTKRDRAAHEVFGWEDLRELASKIKDNVLSNLSEYLIEFEKNAKLNEVNVHWASNAEEHNQIVERIIKNVGVNKIVKSKSMLTEECHLNEHLNSVGIDVVDTDLGERIIQLANESPSHIVMPCIHKKKEEIGDLFHKHLGTPIGLSNPTALTAAARTHLRDKFLETRIALTGVNFAIAETGEFIVCTNEGNADLGVNIADVHIASMGIEKIIPKRNHLGIFLRLLARSGTGQAITTYSSHFRRPRTGQEMHVILVDNGRSSRLGLKDFRSALKCIRCGACMNTCPVYRRSGGHSYNYTISGPIGSILAPSIDITKYSSLPFASTLCGSCSNVCPVKIDIHSQLYKWRQIIAASGNVSMNKKLSMKVMSAVLSNPRIYRIVTNTMRGFANYFPFILNNKLNPWYKNREIPKVPKQSFSQWMKSKRYEPNKR